MSMGKMKLTTRRVRGFRQVHRPLLVLFTFVLGLPSLLQGMSPANSAALRKLGLAPIEENLNLCVEGGSENRKLLDVTRELLQRIDGKWLTFSKTRSSKTGEYGTTQHSVRGDLMWEKYHNVHLTIANYENRQSDFEYDLNFPRLEAGKKVVFTSSTSHRQKKSLSGLWVLERNGRYEVIVWVGKPFIWYRNDEIHTELDAKLKALQPQQWRQPSRRQQPPRISHQQGPWRASSRPRRDAARWAASEQVRHPAGRQRPSASNYTRGDGSTRGRVSKAPARTAPVHGMSANNVRKWDAKRPSFVPAAKLNVPADGKAPAVTGNSQHADRLLRSLDLNSNQWPRRRKSSYREHPFVAQELPRHPHGRGGDRHGSPWSKHECQDVEEFNFKRLEQEINRMLGSDNNAHGGWRSTYRSEHETEEHQRRRVC